MRARFALFLTAALAGCATYRGDLYRGQRLYEENQYENALAIWRSLEVDAESLSPHEQTRYAYLRGMTDYRLGFRADGRHWLAVARAADELRPGGLTPEWKQRLEESLTDLNQEVYGIAERFDTSRSTLEEHAKSPPGEPSPGPKLTGGKCFVNADCPPEHICDNKQCVPL